MARRAAKRWWSVARLWSGAMTMGGKLLAFVVMIGMAGLCFWLAYQLPDVGFWLFAISGVGLAAQAIEIWTE